MSHADGLKCPFCVQQQQKRRAGGKSLTGRTCAVMTVRLTAQKKGERHMERQTSLRERDTHIQETR